MQQTGCPQGWASPAANCSIDAAHRLPAGLGLPQHCIHCQAALAAARGPSQEQGLAPSQRRQRVQCLHGHPYEQTVNTAQTGCEAPPEMATTQTDCLCFQAVLKHLPDDKTGNIKEAISVAQASDKALAQTTTDEDGG